MSYTFLNGTTVRIYTSTPFTSLAGTVVTPDVVQFSTSVQGQTVQTYTWTNGNTPPDPSYTIVLDSTGTFHADLPTGGLEGTWSYIISGVPGVSGLDTTKTSAKFAGEFIVSPLPF